MSRKSSGKRRSPDARRGDAVAPTSTGPVPADASSRTGLALRVLTVAGLLLTAWLAWTGWSGGSPAFCAQGSGCEVVQGSRWSRFIGLPIALWGFALYAALAWTANLASIELHCLLSKAPKLETPTAVAFDFDPGPPAGRLEATRALLLVRGMLDDLGLESYPKTSGGKGMHLYVPLNTPATFDKTKAFAHAFAQLLEREHPELITSNMLKKERTGKVFMDWSQNDTHKTTVCVYSLRAREHPTVSTPVRWEEIEKAVKKIVSLPW